MLSFMREQGSESIKQANAPAGSGCELPGTLPATPSEQYLTVAHKNRVRKSNYLLLVLFCIGMLVLWLMIKKSTPQSASAAVKADVQIEAVLAKLAGVRSEMFSNLDELAERFYKFADIQQVTDLVKNPFRVDVVWSNFGQPMNTKGGTYGFSTETIRQTESQQQTGHMQLLSIMSSDERMCCMIDDRILYEGDSIKGFKVRQIGDSFVKLVQDTIDPNSGKGTGQAEIVLNLAE